MSFCNTLSLYFICLSLDYLYCSREYVQLINSGKRWDRTSYTLCRLVSEGCSVGRELLPCVVISRLILKRVLSSFLYFQGDRTPNVGFVSSQGVIHPHSPGLYRYGLLCHRSQVDHHRGTILLTRTPSQPLWNGRFKWRVWVKVGKWTTTLNSVKVA